MQNSSWSHQHLYSASSREEQPNLQNRTMEFQMSENFNLELILVQQWLIALVAADR